MPSSVETLAQTSIKHICMTFAREIVQKCSDEYGFDFDDACRKFSLREEDLPVPLFDHTQSHPAPPPAKDDMISTLLADTYQHEPVQVAATTIQRKRTARMTPDQKAEQARMKEEEKLAKKVRRETQKKAELDAKALQKQCKQSIKSAVKAEKGALKSLHKSVKIAEQVIKANKTKKAKKAKDPNAPKRQPTPYIVFSKEHRPIVKAEHPDMSSKEIMCELAKRWKALTEDEKSRFKVNHQACAKNICKKSFTTW